jgi:lytic transglycosylase catalytic
MFFESFICAIFCKTDFYIQFSNVSLRIDSIGFFAIFALKLFERIMKQIYFYIVFFICCNVFSQENDDFIDYSKQKEWINKVDKQFIDTEVTAYKFSIEEDFIQRDKESKIKIFYTPIVGKNIEKYLKYKWLPKVIGLLMYYKPLFEYKLKEYGLPQELMYLAIVESSLNPTAISPAGAMGLWQFMPATGANYGLKRGYQINSFFDPVQETEAACKYLKYLYDMLGNWNLVLSAYNAGLGNVHKAILRAKTDDYWQVRRFLPAETRAYVPAFHAIKYIGNSLSTFYKSIPTLKYDFSQVSEEYISKATTFKEYAKKNKVSLNTLYFMNPHILTETIPAGVVVYALLKE